MLLDYKEVHYQEIGQFAKKEGKPPTDRELFLEAAHQKIKDLHNIWVEKETLTSLTSPALLVDHNALTNGNSAVPSIGPSLIPKKTYKL